MLAARGKKNNKDENLSSETERPRPRPVPRGCSQTTRVSKASTADKPSVGDKYRRVVANILAISPSIPTERDLVTRSREHDVEYSDAMEVDFDDADRAEFENDPDADSMEGNAIDDEVDEGLVNSDNAGSDGDSDVGNGAGEDGENGTGLAEVFNEGDNSVDAPVAPRRYGTRATNASKHPGLIDCIPDPDDSERQVKSSRRKTAQPKSAKAKVTDVDARIKATRIAALEDQIRLTEKIRDTTAARPPVGKVTTKVPPARRGGVLQSNRAKIPASVAAVTRPVLPIEEVDELEDDDAYMEPAPVQMVKTKAKKDKREIRSLIDNVRSTPAKMTPVARGPKRKSMDFGELNLNTSSGTEELEAEQSHLPPSKRVKLPQPSGLLPSAKGKGRQISSSSSNAGLQIWSQSRASTPSIAIKMDSESGISTNDYGGYQDGDDTEEAASQSRLTVRAATTTPITRIQFNRPTIKLEQAESSMSSQSRHRPSTNDISPHLRAFWRDGVMPHFRDFLGILQNPWNTDDPCILTELQASYDYGINDGYQIVATDPIHALAFQRIYEWRGRFASAAIAAVSAYWETDEHKKLYPTPEHRADHVAFLLGSRWEFLWGRIEDEANENGRPVKVYSHPFQSSLVLGTLATHLLSTDGLPQTSKVSDPPRGALALSSAAVERALGFWVTGVYIAPKKKHQEFSEMNWGVQTTTQIPNIAKVGDQTWVDIIAGARAIADQKPNAKPTILHRTHNTVNALSAARTMDFETI